MPVANRKDTRSTAAGLRPHIDSTVDEILAVHVIEKTGGPMDKSSVEQQELDALRIFQTGVDSLSDSAIELETEIVYGTRIAEALIDAVHRCSHREQLAHSLR